MDMKNILNLDNVDQYLWVHVDLIFIFVPTFEDILAVACGREATILCLIIFNGVS